MISFDDLLSWLEDNNYQILWTGDRSDARINCPFCGDDDKQHLYISISKNMYHCFRCHASGSYMKLAKELSGEETYAATRKLMRRLNLENFISISDRLTNNPIVIESKEKLQDIPEWFERLADYEPFTDTECQSLNYIESLKYAMQRLTLDEIEYYNIGFCSNFSDLDLRYRMIIPVDGRYFQARTTINVAMKYLNPDYPREDVIFNYDALDNFNTIIICEGCISAIKSGKNAIALLSNKATPLQLKRILKSPVQIFIIAFDHGMEFSDPIMELAKALREEGKTVQIRHYHHGDPDSSNDYSVFEFGMKYEALARFHIYA